MQKYVTFVEEEFYKSFLKMKIIEELEIIVVMQVNIDVQHIVFVI